MSDLADKIERIKTKSGVTIAVWEGKFAYPLTPCCGASAKGGEYGIVCRKCYADIDPMYGMATDITTLDTWIDTWWGGRA
jgi:hypothetical protein